MKLIIDINEKDYQSILNSGFVPYGVVCAIMHGTPLPKGHGRLIDESLLIEDMKCIYKAANELVALGFAESCIEHIPTIIEADGGGEDDLKT